MGRVVLVGETLINLNGPTDRPLDRGSHLHFSFAGAEVNVAIGLARLGHQAVWSSVVGDDIFGEIVVRGLRGEGVDTSCVQVGPGPTALMVKSFRAGAEPEVFYYRKGSAMSQAGPRTFDFDAWGEFDVLYLTGITPALSDSCRALTAHLIDEAHSRQIPVWLDPNYRSKLWSHEEARDTLLGYLPKVQVVFAGLGEGKMLAGSDEPKEIGRLLLQAGAQQAIVKAGAEGNYFFDGNDVIHMPTAWLDRIVDPVGAGDAFAAGVLSSHLEGLSWQEALGRGNAMGAMVSQTLGDWEGLPMRKGLGEYLAMNREAAR